MMWNSHCAKHDSAVRGSMLGNASSSGQLHREIRHYQERIGNICSSGINPSPHRGTAQMERLGAEPSNRDVHLMAQALRRLGMYVSSY